VGELQGRAQRPSEYGYVHAGRWSLHPRFATLRQAVINHRWSYALGNRVAPPPGVRAHEPRAHLMESGI
jgi:hypothetical protein